MNKEFYNVNREDLILGLEDEKCMIVLSSGYEKQKSADENYPFQVNNNFYYLTGITQANVNMILLKDNDQIAEVLYIEPYDERYAKWIGHRISKSEASKISGIYRSNIKYIDEFQDDLNEMLSEYKTVYLDLETSSNTNYNSFALSLKDKLLKDETLQIKDIYHDVVFLRSMKMPCEVRSIKKAINITKSGVESLMKHARPNMYEYELEAYFNYEIKRLGNRDFAFKTIAASGLNATVLHYSTNDSLINDGDLILFDLGCKVDGYSSDISRTFPVNGKFSPLQKMIYNIVLKANKKICKVAKAGMYIKELQEICIEELANGCLKAKLIDKKEDIKKYYFHGVSHSIGLDTHDPIDRELPLPINSIISNEPGLYFPEYNIGVRIEDDLLLKEDKAINLSKGIIKEVKDIEEFMKK